MKKDSTHRSGEIELLKTGRWWDSETHYRNALTWYALHAQAIRAIPANRWEAFQRAGETQEDFTAFRKALENHMWEVEIEDGRERKRWRRGFSEALSKELLAAIEEAAKPDKSALTQRFEAARATLPGNQAMKILEEFKLRQAREFIAALVLQIRLSAATKETRK